VKDWGALLPLVLIVAVFWLFVIRPASRRQKALAATQSSVQIGAEVMLGAGIYGTVVSEADETLQLEVAPGTQLKVARQAVVRVVEPAESYETDRDVDPVDDDPAAPVNPADVQD
jgi:preprotein translocase subunit YajC